MVRWLCLGRLAMGRQRWIRVALSTERQYAFANNNNNNNNNTRRTLTVCSFAFLKDADKQTNTTTASISSFYRSFHPSTGIVKNQEEKETTDKEEREKQKELALSALNEIEEIDPSLLEKISARLQEGRVPPLFHALLMKHFLPNSQLVKSLDPVQEGQATPKTSLELGELAENWKEAINDEGKAVDGIQDTFPSPHKWKFGKYMTKFVVDLVNTEAEMLGHNVEVTTLPSMIHLVDSSKKKELLTRSQSRGIVADCFARIEEHEEVVSAITGSPGIGKSWALLYALQQALLYENACVLFFQQKKKVAYLVMRRNNRLYAWSAATLDDARSLFFEQKNFLVLLDPRESKHGGANYTKPSCGFIYAASNNQNHFRDDAMKLSSDVQRNLAPPTIQELLIVTRRIGNVDDATVLNRVKEVGPLIRYVANEGLFIQRKKQIDNAVKALDEKNLETVLMSEGMSQNALIDNAATTLPGTIFTIMPTKAQDDDKEENDDDDGRTDTSSYDGDGFLYGKRILSVVNNSVLKKVALFNRKNILSFWGHVHCDELGGLGRKVEELFWDDLKDGFQQANVHTFDPKNTRKMNHEPQENIIVLSNEEEAYGTLKNYFESDIANQVIRVPKFFAVIDAVGPGRAVYQVTVSGKHHKPVNGMVELLICAGLLRRNDKNEIIQTEEGKDLDFYWVVPPAQFTKWKTRKRYYQKSKRKDAAGMKDTEWMIFQTCFAERVHQHVLEIPYDSGRQAQS